MSPRKDASFFEPEKIESMPERKKPMLGPVCWTLLLLIASAATFTTTNVWMKFFEGMWWPSNAEGRIGQAIGMWLTHSTLGYFAPALAVTVIIWLFRRKAFGRTFAHTSLIIMALWLCAMLWTASYRGLIG